MLRFGSQKLIKPSSLLNLRLTYSLSALGGQNEPRKKSSRDPFSSRFTKAWTDAKVKGSEKQVERLAFTGEQQKHEKTKEGKHRWIMFAAVLTTALFGGMSWSITNREKAVMKQQHIQDAVELLTNSKIVHKLLGDWTTDNSLFGGHDVKMIKSIFRIPTKYPLVFGHPTKSMTCFRVWGNRRDVICMVRALRKVDSDDLSIEAEFDILDIHFDIIESHKGGDSKMNNKKRFLIYKNPKFNDEDEAKIW